VQAEAAEPAVFSVSTPDGSTWAWCGIDVVATVDPELGRSTFDTTKTVARPESTYVDGLVGIGPNSTVTWRYATPGDGTLAVSVLGCVHGTQSMFARSAAAEIAQRLLTAPGHLRVEPLTSIEAIKRRLHPFPAEGAAALTKRVLHAQLTPRPGQNVPIWVSQGLTATADIHRLAAVLVRARMPVSVNLSAEPRTVDPQWQAELGRLQPFLSDAARARTVVMDVGTTTTMPADPRALQLLDHVTTLRDQLRELVFEFSVTVLAARPMNETLLHDVAAALDSTLELDVRRPRDQAEHSALIQSARTATVAGPPGATVERGRPASWSQSLLTREEARRLCRLPAPDSGPVPGMIHMGSGDPGLHTSAPRGHIVLGRRVLPRDGRGVDGPLGGDFSISPTGLTRHGLIVGSTGSGKSSAVLELCLQLQAAGIPFLVIEPVNDRADDYRWLATRDDFDDLLIFTVGDESTAPFRLNLLDPGPTTTVGAHVDALISMLETTLGLLGPVPHLFRRAFLRCYEIRGWAAEDSAASRGRAGAGTLLLPRLEEFTPALDHALAEFQRAGEEAQNVSAAARQRAATLTSGSLATTLNCTGSVDFALLANRPVVIELAGLGEAVDKKALVTRLILDSARRYRRSRPPGASSDVQVIILEEAHTVFPARRTRDVRSPSLDLAVQRLADAVAEDRKLGLSYVFVDQSPSRLAPEAIDLTDLRLLHGTTSARDLETLTQSCRLSPRTGEQLARLPEFHAIGKHHASGDPALIRIPDRRGEAAAAAGLHRAPLADDDELRRRHDEFVFEFFLDHLFKTPR
jgi:DNA helicase HerA-like ATPase